MNPRTQYILDFFKINLEIEPEIVVIEYTENNISPVITLLISNPDPTDSHPLSTSKEISLSKYAKLLSDFTTINIKVGTDKKSLYEKDSHRKIVYTRFILPQGLLQIDYEDDTENINFDPQISEFMRKFWQVV